ncbi:hypothetical protein HK405_001576, partial [Cladochytrium tenue]
MAGTDDSLSHGVGGEANLVLQHGQWAAVDLALMAKFDDAQSDTHNRTQVRDDLSGGMGSDQADSGGGSGGGKEQQPWGQSWLGLSDYK